jgi:hypothetical protein
MSGAAVAISLLAFLVGVCVGGIVTLCYNLSRLSDLEWRLGVKGPKR